MNVIFRSDSLTNYTYEMKYEEILRQYTSLTSEGAGFNIIVSISVIVQKYCQKYSTTLFFTFT